MLNGIFSGMRERIDSFLTKWLGDSYKIATLQDKFILSELADRALANKGFARTAIGLPVVPIYRFVVATGKDYVEEAVNYGEYVEAHPETYDSLARIAFDGMKRFFLTSNLINTTGKEVHALRQGIKDVLNPARGAAETHRVFSTLIQNWPEADSVNDTIFVASVIILAKVLFNIEDLPKELFELLKQAEYVVFNENQVPKKVFNALRDKFQELNKEITNRNEKNIREGQGYLKFLFDKGYTNSFTEPNAVGSLIVVGNIASVITAGALKLATTTELREKVQAELKQLGDIDFGSPQGLAALKKCEFLHKYFLECLRFYHPAGPVVRYASKPGKIGDQDIQSRTFIFIPIRRIMHDPNIWGDPENFNPDRHQGRHFAFTYPMVGFSLGGRICPASFGFAEALFDVAIANLFAKNELVLSSHQAVESIPINVKEPRLQQKYFGKVQPLAQPQAAEGPSVVHNFETVKKAGRITRASQADDQDKLAHGYRLRTTSQLKSTKSF